MLFGYILEILFSVGNSKVINKYFNNNKNLAHEKC